MINLRDETEQFLKQNGKTKFDVRYIVLGNGENAVGIDTYSFWYYADHEYDNSYGGVEVSDIRLVGDDWWLERGEYDGSEWWEFKIKPSMPTKFVEASYDLIFG